MTNDLPINTYSQPSSLPVHSANLRLPTCLGGHKIGLETTNDINGTLWFVKRKRPTKYGFDLLFGYPVGRAATGRRRLIATGELLAFWEANKARHDGMILDLPACESTLCGLRRRLGFKFHQDNSKFWMDRLHDLKTMPTRKFAAKHGCRMEIVIATRLRILGTKIHTSSWWALPENVEFLRSCANVKEICTKYGIGRRHAYTVRARAMLNA